MPRKGIRAECEITENGVRCRKQCYSIRGGFVGIQWICYRHKQIGRRNGAITRRPDGKETVAGKICDSGFVDGDEFRELLRRRALPPLSPRGAAGGFPPAAIAN